MYDLAVIGGGNMGAALLGGLLSGGVVTVDQVVIVELYAERRQQLEAMFPGVTLADPSRIDVRGELRAFAGGVPAAGKAA